MDKDWLLRAADPLKAAGVVAIRVTKIYHDGVQESEDYTIADHLITDVREPGKRTLFLNTRERVAAQNKAQRERWAREAEERDRRYNCPG